MDKKQAFETIDIFFSPFVVHFIVHQNGFKKDLPLSASDRNVKFLNAKVHALNTSSIIFKLLRIIKLLEYDMSSFNFGFFHSRLRVRFQNTAISWNGISVTLIYIKTHYDKMHTISIKDKWILKYTSNVQLERIWFSILLNIMSFSNVDEEIYWWT